MSRRLHHQVDLDADPREVSRARALTRTKLGCWGLDQLTGLAVLVVSELVTNAVIHGYGPAQLRLTFNGRLRVEVRDLSPAPPRLRDTCPGELGGRGLQIVNRLSESWGWRPHGRGKLVWCELRPLGRVIR
ncbi:MAG: ATP-binding protein [Carbonactinosporaceae bacterium]